MLKWKRKEKEDSFTFSSNSLSSIFWYVDLASRGSGNVMVLKFEDLKTIFFNIQIIKEYFSQHARELMIEKIFLDSIYLKEDYTPQ